MLALNIFASLGVQEWLALNWLPDQPLHNYLGDFKDDVIKC